MASVITADHIGNVKIHDLQSKKCLFNSHALNNNTTAAVQHIQWTDHTEQYTVVVYNTGLIHLFDVVNNQLINTYTHCQSTTHSNKRSVYGHTIVSAENTIVALHIIQNETNRYMLTCSATGLLQIVVLSTESQIETTILLKYQLSHNDTDTNHYNNKNVITACQYDSTTHNIIIGGIEILPTVYHIDIKQLDNSAADHSDNTVTFVYQSNNVPDTTIGIRIPVHIKATAINPVNHNQFVTVTGVLVNYSKLEDLQQRARIRFYDLEKTDAVADIEYIEYDINTVQYTHDGRYVIIGDNSGRIQAIDCHKYKLIHKYISATGAVTDIQTGHSIVPVSNNSDVTVKPDQLIAVCSIDRHIRIYNIKTKQITFKLFCKQKLNKCLFSYKHIDSTVKIEKDTVKTEVDIDDDVVVKSDNDDVDESVWNELQQKTQANKKRLKQRPVE